MDIDHAFTILQSCIGGLVLTTIAGGFYLHTWSEVGTLFAAFAGIIYVTIRWVKQS
jgi:hypothetical protein